MGYGHYIPEKDVGPASIPLEALIIIGKQSKNNILKITNQNNEKGTGFFCLIPFPDKFHLLPTLMTNNHVLDENDIKEGKTIKFSSEVRNYEIKIDNLRKCYTNKEYDTTFIEIRKNEVEDINKFLEIDEDIFNDNELKTFSKSSVYIIHCPGGIQIKISFGKIKSISPDSLDIYHECNTSPGSSGGPIINSINYKIIGIHKGAEIDKQLNLGTFLKIPITNFIEKYSNIIDININNNEIINDDNKINKNDLDRKDNNDNNESSLFSDENQNNINNNYYNNKINNNPNNNQINVDNIVDEITIFYSKEYIKSGNFWDKLLPKMFSKETFSDCKIFGEAFVKNNKNYCKIIIDKREYQLSSYIKEVYNEYSCFLELKLKGVSKIRNMTNMFCGCLSLISVPDIDMMNTSNIFSMSNIFSGCESLASLPDISKWNTDKVLDIGHMFQYCLLLTSLPDISKWNTSRVQNMAYVFCMCEQLLSLPDISKWDTSQVKSFFCMFNGCKSLNSLPDISKWNTRNIKNMGFMFDSCKNLYSLPDISCWNTCNLEDTRYMFNNCSSLISFPDLTKWNTNKIKETNNMFSGCKANSNILDKFNQRPIFSLVKNFFQ